MHDKITRRHVSIGAAIERAAAELPEGYDLMIEVEKDAGTVTLLIPPMGDDEGGQALHDWEGDHFGYQINKAIDHAIEHHRAHMDVTFNTEPNGRTSDPTRTPGYRAGTTGD